MDDWKLLQDYAQGGSESAFDALIGRHLNLVYSSALRQVNDPHLAQEVSQAVFILLARKAESLPRNVVVAGWLFRTTRFVAARSLRAEQRRWRRDQEAYQMQNLTTPDNAWKKIAPILDEALGQLGETDRNALLLRFVEEKNHREVGVTLGLSEEAARKRVDRALEKIRGFFAGRGFTMSATVLASALLANASQAAPAAVAGSVKAAAFASGAAGAGALPLLVSQTLNAWRWAKLKFAASLAIVGTVVVTLVTMVASTREAARPSILPIQTSANALATNTSPRLTSPVWSAKKSAVPRTGSTLRLLVVAKDTGEPVTKARLAVNTVSRGEWSQRFDLFTDASGGCDVPLPSELGRLDVGVLSPGWEARYATFKRDWFPEQYTLHVERVTNSIGGWLKDEAGKPVANAQVRITFLGGGDASARETSRERVGFEFDAPAAISDVQGHWSCSFIPIKNPGFQLEALHPDFSPASISTSSEAQVQLWKGTMVSLMERGISLAGRIMDNDGHPLAGARITHQPQSMKPLEMTTDAEGRFIIPKLPRSDFDFTVMAEGFAPEYRNVEVEKDMPPVEVRLEPAAVLRLRIVDEKGVEVPGAEAILEQWGEHRHVLPWSATSDSQGRIEWNSAPPRKTLDLCARKEGWCYTRDIRVVPDGEEHVITLHRALQLTCHVTDADTGLPIADFKAFPGYGDGSGEAVWERLSTKHGTNGMVVVDFQEARKPWRLCVEADEYESTISEPLKGDHVGTLEIALKRGNQIRGVVLRPDGSPAPDVQVAALGLEYSVQVEVQMGKFQGGQGVVATTDNSGLFSFPPNRQVHSLAAVSPEGFIKQPVSTAGSLVTLRLQPWGRIEGTVSESARRWRIDNVVLFDEPATEYKGSARFRVETSVNESGQFVFEKAPPGEFSLFLVRGFDIPYSCRTEVSVRPGETVHADIGGKGRALLGKVALIPGGVKDGQGNQMFATLTRSDEQLFPRATDLSGEAAKRWAVTYWQSEPARRYFLQRTPSVWLANDGSFRAEEVMPGSYKLTIQGKGILEREIVIPEDGLEDVTLGALELRN